MSEPQLKVFLTMHLDLSTDNTRAYAKQISTASLGDHSYIVVVGDEAVAVDIQRDLDRFENVLDGVNASLVAVFETHIHNDYVSGGKRLAEHHGATYVLPAGTGAPYDHSAFSDGDSLAVGGWVMRGLHTPGHTHDHMSYVLESPDGPVAIFSGGSMLVGAVGRSDLLGPDHTETLLRGQYESMHRITEGLPDPALVAPTHGSGSFCSASDVADTTSTVGEEKLRNPALIASSVEDFASSQVLGYKQFPIYYRHMAPSNLKPMGEPPVKELPLLRSLDGLDGEVIVDVRPFGEYASGHLPGSLSFELSNDTAVYMGWTMKWGTPVVLVGDESNVEEVRVQLQRIGWDDVVGRIDPQDLPTLVDVELLRTTIVTFSDLGEAPGRAVLDVRDPVEHLGGVVPGAVLAHFADVAADPGHFARDGGVLVYCASGNRAGIASSFLEQVGGGAVVVRDDISKYEGTLVAPEIATR